MTGLFVASVVSSVAAFAALAGWVSPVALGHDLAAAWLAVSGASALMSASALDA